MYRERPAETEQEHIEDLIHLYIDGAFDRRELLKRVADYIGFYCGCNCQQWDLKSWRKRALRRPYRRLTPGFRKTMKMLRWVLWVDYGSEVGNPPELFRETRFETRRVRSLWSSMRTAG